MVELRPRIISSTLEAIRDLRRGIVPLLKSVVGKTVLDRFEKARLDSLALSI